MTAPPPARSHVPSLLRTLAPRIAALAGVAAGLGALATALATHALGTPRAWLALAVTAALGALGAWLVARAWIRRVVVAPLRRLARTLVVRDALPTGSTITAELPALLPEELADVQDRFARLAEQLRAEQAQRARAQKLATVGHMAAGIAHEVGNPLAAISSYAHVLRSRAADVRGATEILDALERECARIDRIVTGLLDYARPRRVTPTAVDVNDVLLGACRLLTDQGVLRRIRVQQELDASTPTVFGERPELEQVFVNLLLNAADAMQREGTIALRTRIVAIDELRVARGRAGDAPGYAPPRPNRRVAEWLSGATRAPRRVTQIVVADSGPGIAADDAERVFDPFYTTKQPGRGTGLGLAVVARIVDALGGAVWVQRAREGGAAFVIVLPLASGHSADTGEHPRDVDPQLALFAPRNESTRDAMN